MLPDFGYVRPKSLADVVRELSAAGARLHAGGTDLLGCLRDGVFSASKVVSLGSTPGLRGIKQTRDEGLEIGAMTTLTEIAEHRAIVERYPGLAQGAAAAASPQLRNQGTIGGNLCQKPRCWYYRGDFHCYRKGGDTCFAVEGENQYHCIFGGEGCYIVHPSDTAPVLVALQARVRVVGPKGTRLIPVGSFFVLPKAVLNETVLQAGEVVTAVLLPPAPGVRSSYRKVRARASWDFALAGIALAIAEREGRIVDARVVLSGVAPIPWRSTAAERVINGQRLNAGLIERAAAAAVEGAEPLSQNGYKVDLVRAIVQEALAAHLVV